MPKVYIKIPKSGLGNMMLVWAYGIAFAEINQFEIVVSRWWGFRWGALIRREKKNRLYLGYFREEPLISRMKISVACIYRKKVFNPSLKKVERAKMIYIFDKLPPNHFFIDIYPHLNTVRQKLLNLLSESVLKEFNFSKRPDIGIHIRRGDFKISNHITPVSYFIDLIMLIRKTCGNELSVTVFTDAGEDEISEILKLPKTELAKNKFDVVDILQFSKSRILILSRDSSFSYWSAFLSEGFVVMTSEDWQNEIKPSSENYREFRYSKSENEKELQEALYKHL